MRASRWVHRNIKSFRGDRNKVTLFGQSASCVLLSSLTVHLIGTGAGACSVFNHLVMPASKGLFAAAIMESGDADTWSLQFSLQHTARVLARLDCANTSVGEQKACLGRKSVHALLAVQGDSSPAPHTTDSQALPTVDGVSLPADPLAMMQRGRMHKGLQIIVGANTNDDNLFVT